ncbi:MAG: hypothetical protein NUV50_10555 [Rhodospirillales bacterium]|nr:hypothetical protein [Rhodospirillales bacterium]
MVLGMLVIGMILVPAPTLADQVSVQASVQDGFGRLTFRWPQPVGHQATRQGDRMVVTFSRPIQADLRPALRDLGAYIASIEPAPNEATVAFRLKGDFTVRSYDSGTSVVVDIVGAAPATPKPTPEPGPVATPAPVSAAPASSASPTGPAVAVRVGVHPTYSRIVFDWPTNTTFSLTRDGDKAQLNFNAAASVDLAGFASGRVRNINAASASSKEGKLTVTLNVDPTSQVKASNNGPKVVVDVYPPGTQPAVAASSAPTSPVSVSAPVAAKDGAPAPMALTPPTPDEAVKPAEADAQSPAAEKTAPATPSAATPTPATAPAPASAPAVNTRAEASQVAAGVVALRFDWQEPVGAAVFRRGEVLWVIFDKRANIDTAALVRDGAGMIASAEQVPSNLGAVLRLTTAEGVNPDIKRSGLAWILEFMEQPLIPTSPLQADAQPDSPLGARLFVSVPEPGNVIAFRDPEVGDNLIAVPVIPLGHGVSRLWAYPQVQVLPTKQGVVIKPISDDVSVRPLRQGVEVTSTGTLQISSVSAEEKAAVNLETALASSAGMGSFRPLTRVLDLEKWKRADLQDFIDVRQNLQRTIAFAEGNKAKAEARRELMQFYLTNGFEAEALGVMEVMLSAQPELEKNPEFLMLRGAANWLMGRLEDARADLYSTVLDGTDEAIFWRAAVLAKEGHMPDAAYDLRRTGGITQPYPKAMKMPTATLVADAAVELGDVKQATQYLEVLAIDDPSQTQKNQIDYVAGKLKDLGGDPDGAIADWESVMEGVHRPSRAKAAVARTELLLKQGNFTPKDAIEEFEKLRFVWRGDDFEFALLRRLGSLYLEQQLYREGLNTLRQAATNFPDHEGANQVTKLMSDSFQNLYLNNGADVLAPVTAIALYDEFRELTPPGKLGDEMIRRLADRLVGVDLLSSAADLLESQVDFRLKGEEKARVGARLALIYLFDRKFELVLSVLDKTDASGLGDDLVLQRLLLRARAYIGLQQPEVALDLLRPEIALEAESIRSGIYWRAGDWKNASKSLTVVVRELGAKPRQPLDDKQALAVLSLAVAFTLEGNEAGVSRAVANFGPAMASTAYADAYQLITSGPENDLVNFRALDAIVKKVDDFQGFMEVYRQRLADGQLSAVY